ncbi:sigma-70 family RNA polymerase sigma factor [Streptomyces sp. APSN-46.1]|uniref:sigma-70 family RNA polymerase sigma factor n=1 Tax=Streptomyces sp. APSN-46.1 TaxID=2929049 RepID=UPI001FB31369|nr:sigma-70 family RNA polymerase sigma factor [Streptomyces sp. APSN-46.1]MCJ1678245.1 sigma-70 family RNA polymerase sigma factor [Streptomyces sp. APSN-46.1]
MEDVIEACVEALVEDSERLGRLERAHIVQVASRRGIDPQQLGRVFAVLREYGVLGEEPGSKGAAPGEAGDAKPTARNSRDQSEAYPGRIGRHRILTAEEEVALGRRIQMGLQAAESVAGGEVSGELAELVRDGEAARRSLVRHNVRLAIDIARRYLPSAGDLELDDLIQDGVLGINRAAEKFNPTLGYKFSTYASWWVRQSVTRAIANTSSAVRLPVHIRDDLRRVEQYARRFEERNGCSATVAELAEGLGEKPEEIRALLDYSAPVIHLDVPVSEEGGATLGDLVLASKAERPEDETIRQLLREQILGTISTLLAGTDPRLARLLEGRFGLDGEEPMTLDALGKEFGCTRERVRQLEKRLFERLRENRGLRQLTVEFLAMEAA